MAGNPFPGGVGARAVAGGGAGDAGAGRRRRLVARLERYRGEGEGVAVVGGDLWVHLPHGIAASRLSGAITPARAGGAGTFRNWNTVRRIGAALG